MNCCTRRIYRVTYDGSGFHRKCCTAYINTSTCLVLCTTTNTIESCLTTGNVTTSDLHCSGSVRYALGSGLLYSCCMITIQGYIVNELRITVNHGKTCRWI